MHEHPVCKEGVRTYCELGVALYGQGFKVGRGFPKEFSMHNVTLFVVCLVHVLTNFGSNKSLRMSLTMKPPLQANHE